MNQATAAQDLANLKQLAGQFPANTKAEFSTCTFAAMNVNDGGFVNMWADFKSAKQAKMAAFQWAIALRMKPRISVEGSCYRVCIGQ
jgi:hypothetical protein